MVDTLTDIEADVRLFVLGKCGEHADFATLHLRAELERVVRAVHRPVLLASRAFTPIPRFAIAYDGSPTAQKAVDRVAGRPLFKGMPCHLITAGTDDDATRAKQRIARESLERVGFGVHASIRSDTADRPHRHVLKGQDRRGL
ncbi:hypothetical protein [Tahibacter sp.]|uniref:hypothetical protein n=1 Tax=Tahibacter sp. TaxID=2056211 RepID=UPI0028C4E72B|nr:hypothetical protein [Tahibacter sp.]